MNCFSTEAELVALQDGRLDAARELAVHAHLETCAECRRRADEWGRLVPVMRRLAPAAPSGLRARRMELEIARLASEKPAPRRTAGARVFVWGGLAVAAAAAVLLVVRARGGAERAEAPAAAMSARVTAVAGAARAGDAPLGSGSTLRAGDALVVDAAGAATFAVADASVTLQGPARLVLRGDAAHVALDLDQGLLEASVTHRAPGATFLVATRDGRVEVRGTRFSVRADRQGSEVAVDEGRVAVFARDGAERSVSAGQRIALAATGFVEAAAASPAVEPAPAPASAGARPCDTSGPSCETTAQRARASMRAGDARRALRLVEGAMAARLDCVDAEGASGCRDELRYLRAEALRQDGRFDAAVSAYKALDHHGAPAAMRQNAFYAAAQLERRLGRQAAARADFERALAAAPAGALREEALLGAMDAAAAAGEQRRAAELAARYLQAFPSGLGAARARAVGSAGR
jgi:ferric-dicitrate binding protein FerR (iron transport regulator)